MSGATRRVRVQVPATSANLGPGFDTLGLALGYGDELTVTATPKRAADRPRATVRVTGEGAGEVPTDDTNLVVRAIHHVFRAVGHAIPDLELDAVNRIPHGRGMGSSAAAIVSGVMAARGLIAGGNSAGNAPAAGDAEGGSAASRLTTAHLLELATELEGHPDNVAPALLGGLTIAWTHGGAPHAKPLVVHRGVAPLVLVPDFQVSTRLARSLQPAQVPYADAVFNVSRAALLVAALTQSPELLFAATEDRLHQSYRSSAMPRTAALVAELREAGHAAVVSGAGPSILVLANGSEERLQVVNRVRAAHPDWTRHALAVDSEGATVEEVPLGSRG